VIRKASAAILRKRLVQPLPLRVKARDIYIPDLHIDSIKVKTRDFR
jgi:hypothetical protein